MQIFKCHQIPQHPLRDHGGLHIMMERFNSLRNIGLQHKILSHYG
jgi:hypothetical protein